MGGPPGMAPGSPNGPMLTTCEDGVKAPQWSAADGIAWDTVADEPGRAFWTERTVVNILYFR